VSRICAALDADVQAFRARSLGKTGFPSVWFDAAYLKVREHGRVVSVAALVNRQEGPLGPSARLQQAGEVAPVAHPRDGQRPRTHAGVPAPFAIAVAVRQASLRVALAPGPRR
jgi:hypothetical protein